MSLVPLVDVLTRTERWFRERGIPSPRFEAELILAHVLGMKRLELYLAHDRPLDEADLERLRAVVARRGRREPLAWILGSVGFHTIELEIGPGVLVPRPDTETLVDAALELIAEADDPVYVADIGSGSGAVGLAIAAVRPGVRVFAVDASPEALDCTRRNVAKLGLDKRVAVLRGDLLAPIPPDRRVDWIVSNPPYIPSRQLPTLQPEVSRWEPRLALDGGRDGLAVYRKLVPAAARRAARGVLVEVGAGQAGQVSELFRRAGLVRIQTWPDLAGIPRVVGGHTPANDAAA
ncbi:MAG: release factor glutamine methyltransferase [Myxococcota bacterium]